MEKKISYYSGDFQSFYNQLVDYAKRLYPDTYTDFEDAAIGTLYFELAAAVGDNLRFNIERAVQETQIENAQERASLFAMARTFGLNIPNKRPAITIVDITVDLPPNGNSFDVSYAPFIVRGASFSAQGVVFETKYNVDFSSPYSENGIPNRIIVPNIDNSGRVESYSVTKQELVVSGKTVYQKFPISSNIVAPFMKLSLPDTDVISVESITELEGVNIDRLPTISEQQNERNRWELVSSLAQQHIFVPRPTLPTDQFGVMVGEWKYITKKFIAEFAQNGFCEITFGGGVNRNNSIQGYSENITAMLNGLNNFNNSLATGEIPRAATTLFVKYRVGGGQRSNVSQNTITRVESVNLVVQGQNPTINQQVRGSLRVNNRFPAFGGADIVSNEELRYMIKYNFNSQERCVTLQDYYARLMLMDNKFGVPSRVSVAKIDNKVAISIIGRDGDGKFSNTSTNTLKQNIAEYLSQYRTINDYVVIQDGKIINLKFDVILIINRNANRGDVSNAAITAVQDFVNKNSRQMGQDLFITELIGALNDIDGVLSVNSVKVFNPIAGDYSLNQIGMDLVNTTTREVKLGTLNALLCGGDSIFEVKFPNRDIRVGVSAI